ncbi:inner membrane protein YiaA [Shewanella surugensis]|uniref:YiaAB two helix domain-containing protein n=1 Tax=Shewanella surugensis TaxID=212020 RepID=A0ABT0LIF7_9GAMM|nr:inner membrane protein YiaA [Shewanella surugensis]MCL1127445.1 hypothetical protein [Shewanella surugensis]
MLLIQSIYFTAIRYVFKVTRKGLSLTQQENVKMTSHLSYNHHLNQPTKAYIAATWVTLAIGVIGYLMGLWNATIALNEKGYYFAIFLLAMFSAVTLQKTVRDREEGIPVTSVFLGMCWFAFSAAIALLVVGLFNAQFALSEKGFYGMAFIVSLFAIITVQKNTRDLTNEQGITDPAAFPNMSNSLGTAGEVTEVMDKL